MTMLQVEKPAGYTVMSSHHLHNPELSLNAKGLLSVLLSVPEAWDATLQGLTAFSREDTDTINEAVRELEQAGYITKISPEGIGLVVHEIPIHSIPATGRAADQTEERNGSGSYMEAVKAYEEVIKDNIEYAYLVQDKTINRALLDEIVSLIVETVCTRRKVVRIAGDDYPAELVKSKFMKLDSSHIQFVLSCMQENTTKIRNIKKYLLAVLFNAPNTIDSYYTAAVNHDMHS